MFYYIYPRSIYIMYMYHSTSTSTLARSRAPRLHISFRYDSRGGRRGHGRGLEVPLDHVVAIVRVRERLPRARGVDPAAHGHHVPHVLQLEPSLTRGGGSRVKVCSEKTTVATGGWSRSLERGPVERLARHGQRLARLEPPSERKRVPVRADHHLQRTLSSSLWSWIEG
jgi:hypothetical protein